MFEFGTVEYWKGRATKAQEDADFWKDLANTWRKFYDDEVQAHVRSLSTILTLRKEAEERKVYGGLTLAEYDAGQAAYFAKDEEEVAG